MFDVVWEANMPRNLRPDQLESLDLPYVGVKAPAPVLLGQHGKVEAVHANEGGLVRAVDRVSTWPAAVYMRTVSLSSDAGARDQLDHRRRGCRGRGGRPASPTRSRRATTCGTTVSEKNCLWLVPAEHLLQVRREQCRGRAGLISYA